ACRSSSSQDDPDRTPNGIWWGAYEEWTGRRATPHRHDAWRVRLGRAVRTPRSDDGRGSVGWRLRGAGARPGRPEVSGVSGVEGGEPRGQLILPILLCDLVEPRRPGGDRKSTRLNSS